jgi:hypothetical protein
MVALSVVDWPLPRRKSRVAVIARLAFAVAESV